MAKRKNIIPYETLGRLMKESGAERVSHAAVVALAKHLEQYAAELTAKAMKYAEHSHRKTINYDDIRLADKSLER